MMFRVSCVIMAVVLTAVFSVEANAAPQPFPDCGLARYDAGLPARIVLTLRAMAGKLGTLPSVEIDVTDIAYDEGVLSAVPDCLDPNVGFLADADDVAIELRGLAHDTCRNLVDSPELRAARATVQVRDVRTNDPMASCGHHPTFELFGVGIGLNVVVVRIPRQFPPPPPLHNLDVAGCWPERSEEDYPEKILAALRQGRENIKGLQVSDLGQWIDITTRGFDAGALVPETLCNGLRVRLFVKVMEEDFLQTRVYLVGLRLY
ncbi:MAG: hypothetical protein ACREJ0_02795, partial [Geminicoccaceae bacterium]